MKKLLILIAIIAFYNSTYAGKVFTQCMARIAANDTPHSEINKQHAEQCNREEVNARKPRRHW